MKLSKTSRKHADPAKVRARLEQNKAVEAARSDTADVAPVVSKVKEIDGRTVLYEPGARINGGPRHGRVVLVRDMRREVRGAEHRRWVAEQAGHTDLAWTECPYVKTRRTTTLPGFCDEKGQPIKGEVWDWRKVPPHPLVNARVTPLMPQECTACGRGLLFGPSRERGVCAACKPIEPAMPAGWEA